MTSETTKPASIPGRRTVMAAAGVAGLAVALTAWGSDADASTSTSSGAGAGDTTGGSTGGSTGGDTTGGSARRGPVTLRKRDLERLRAGLAERPGLAEALGLRPP